MDASTASRLNARSERIEQVLGARGAACRAIGGSVLPGFVEIRLEPAAQTKVAQVRALQADLGVALGSPNVRVAVGDRGLTVQIPRSKPDQVLLSALMARMSSNPLPEFTSVLGLAEDGAVLAACLASPDVSHVLIAGTTGSGKTSLAQSMMLSLAAQHRPSQIGFVVIDPTNGFMAGRHLLDRHLLRPVAIEPDAAIGLLQVVVRQMETRGAERDPRPRIVVYVDEVADLIMTGGESVLMLLTRIAQRGRQSGVHLVVATQKPNASVVGPLFKANLPFRLIGRVMSPEDAKVASGMPGTGAERLSGRGDFLAVSAGRIIRFQAALPGTMLEQYSPAPVSAPAPARAPAPAPAPAVVDANAWRVVEPEIPVASAVPALPEPEPEPESVHAVVEGGGRAPVNVETVRAARVLLEARGQKASGTNVLRLLGHAPSGAAWRQYQAVSGDVE
jgi:DNA segregation ATPase FtsK/SpoIIIE, S-DNA-T family